MIKVLSIKKVSKILWEMSILNTATNVDSCIYANKKFDLLLHAKQHNFIIEKQITL